MKDYKNSRWTRDDLIHQYKIENPNMTVLEIEEKVNIVYTELKKINRNLNYNTNKYFKHNTPLSYFEEKDSDTDFDS